MRWHASRSGLAAASDLDWGAAVSALIGTISLIAIGRGPTLAIAREASLKLKETRNLHAEAFSGTEHGPMALVSSHYPVLMFMATDAAAEGISKLAGDLRRRGIALLSAEAGAPAAGRLPALSPDHAETDAVCLIQSFYAMTIRLAQRLGTDVDHPRYF